MAEHFALGEGGHADVGAGERPGEELRRRCLLEVLDGARAGEFLQQVGLVAGVTHRHLLELPLRHLVRHVRLVLEERLGGPWVPVRA